MGRRISFLPNKKLKTIKITTANKTECEKRWIISKSKNCIKWSASNAKGNNPAKINSLTLNVETPIANPQITCPSKCSNEIRLTSNGFPIICESGKWPKSKKCDGMSPMSENKNEHNAKRPDIFIKKMKLERIEIFL